MAATHTTRLHQVRLRLQVKLEWDLPARQGEQVNISHQVLSSAQVLRMPRHQVQRKVCLVT